MHFAATLIEAAVPWITPEGHAIVVNLALRNGRPGPAKEFAVRAGLRNRWQVVRLLDREGLPRLEELAGWIRVLVLVLEWESSGTALSRAALTSGRDPRPLYETVRRLTKRPWSEVRELGSAWLILQLVRRCDEIKACQSGRGRTGS